MLPVPRAGHCLEAHGGNLGVPLFLGEAEHLRHVALAHPVEFPLEDEGEVSPGVLQRVL